MAINYLNSINLNQNELIKARVENQPNNAAAGTGVEGQIYYDTTLDKIKVWANGAWTAIGAGVNSVTSGDTDKIDVDNTDPANPILYANVAPVSDGSTNLVTGDDVYNFVTGFGFVESVSSGNSTFVSTAITGTGVDPIVTASLSATGTPDNTKYLRGDNTWSPISGIYSFDVSDGTTASTVTNTQTVTFSGTANEITTSQSGRTVTIGLPNDVTIAGVLTVSGTGQSSFGGQVTIPTTPSASTDAASKAYVDSMVVGGLIYQGGYDAATDTPNLDQAPFLTGIKKGWTYTVTVEGTFFSEQVRVGDVLIAEIDNPTTLANWTTVQNNIDLASLTQIGIGNVNPLPGASGIDVTYSSGTALIENIDKGSSQNIFKNIAVAGQSDIVAENNNDTLTFAAGVGIAIGLDPVTDTITITGQDIPALMSYATTISNTATITHSLGTKDVMVQLYDTVTFDTVYADVTRPTINTVTVTFASAPTNPIRVLVQK